MALRMSGWNGPKGLSVTVEFEETPPRPNFHHRRWSEFAKSHVYNLQTRKCRIQKRKPQIQFVVSHAHYVKPALPSGFFLLSHLQTLTPNWKNFFSSRRIISHETFTHMHPVGRKPVRKLGYGRINSLPPVSQSISQSDIRFNTGFSNERPLIREPLRQWWQHVELN